MPVCGPGAVPDARHAIFFDFLVNNWFLWSTGGGVGWCIVGHAFVAAFTTFGHGWAL